MEKAEDELVTMEPEIGGSGCGLYLPGKDRMVYVPPERKSPLGLDVLAMAKRTESQHDGGFKVPKERTISIAASAEDEDKSESSVAVVDESGHGGIDSKRRHGNRRYCETTNETPVTASSPWDHVSPSPIPIRASGSSVKSSVYRNNRRSHQLTFSSETANIHEDEVADKFDLGEEHKYEITESIRC